jgi:hypothetical protein
MHHEGCDCRMCIEATNALLRDEVRDLKAELAFTGDSIRKALALLKTTADLAHVRACACLEGALCGTQTQRPPATAPKGDEES